MKDKPHPVCSRTSVVTSLKGVTEQKTTGWTENGIIRAEERDEEGGEGGEKRQPVARGQNTTDLTIQVRLLWLQDDYVPL